MSGDILELVLAQELSYGSWSGITLTIPSGGGFVNKALPVSGFIPDNRTGISSLNVIDFIVDVYISNVNPAQAASAVVGTQYGLAGNSLALGLTLSASVGVTLTANALVMGH